MYWDSQHIFLIGKACAQNWTKISDQEFVIGLDFMLQNKIIVISNFNYEHSSMGDVPSWFRNASRGDQTI